MKNNNKFNKRTKFKSAFKDDKQKTKESSIPDENDWKFYAASEEIARDVASIPFNYLGGTPFRVGVKNTSEGGEIIRVNNDAIPSVMSLRYTNSIGRTDTKTQGANMASVQLYTKIRSKNSGAKNYEAPDVMMYILEMADIYSEFFEDKKILGMACLYNYYNHNLPDILINTHNIDPNDLRANIAQYRARLNVLAKKINSFAVPKYFKIFDRKAYVSSYVFSDSTSLRGQFYNYVKGGYYMWSGTTSETGTELQFYPHTSNVITFDKKLDILESMLDSLFLDEDALTMSGDILKAFEEGGLYTVNQTEEGYVVPITMDENALAQIENSVSFLPFGNTVVFSNGTYDFNVKQENQIIKFAPTVLGYHNESNDWQIAPALENVILNSHKDNPDYKDCLEWTRLMTMITNEFESYNTLMGTQSRVTLSSSGLEIVLKFSLYYYSGNAIVKKEFGSLSTGSDIMAKVGQFDWHPTLYNLETATVAPNYMADLKVATVVDKDTLDKINDAAVYGALYGSIYNQ